MQVACLPAELADHLGLQEFIGAMRNVKGFQSLAVALLAALLPCLSQAASLNQIRPGAVWLDNRGQPIQAHGGGILRYGHTWYWFGEDRSTGQDPRKHSVTCYSSSDLEHWKFRGYALQLSDPEHLGPHWVLERPKVYYSPLTHHFVMYMHLDNAHYRYAHVATAISSRITGPYKYVRSFRPLGLESRDIGQFVDDDGSAYLIFESRPSHGFYIAQLSADRLSIEKQTAFLAMPLEGGALVHDQGLYYVLGSHMTGWRPNPNVYATAKALSGPWSEFKQIAPASPDTYGSQSTMLFKVTGKKQTTVVFMGDIWKPRSLWDSRYLWMPLQMGDGTMLLPPPSPWTIDTKTGVACVSACGAGPN